jgi:hypothetical protein
MASGEPDAVRRRRTRSSARADELVRRGFYNPLRARRLSPLSRACSLTPPISQPLAPVKHAEVIISASTEGVPPYQVIPYITRGSCRAVAKHTGRLEVSSLSRRPLPASPRRPCPSPLSTGYRVNHSGLGALKSWLTMHMDTVRMREGPLPPRANNFTSAPPDFPPPLPPAQINIWTHFIGTLYFLWGYTHVWDGACGVRAAQSVAADDGEEERGAAPGQIHSPSPRSPPSPPVSHLAQCSTGQGRRCPSTLSSSST